MPAAPGAASLGAAVRRVPRPQPSRCTTPPSEGKREPIAISRTRLTAGRGSQKQTARRFAWARANAQRALAAAAPELEAKGKIGDEAGDERHRNERQREPERHRRRGETAGDERHHQRPGGDPRRPGWTHRLAELAIRREIEQRRLATDHG